MLWKFMLWLSKAQVFWKDIILKNRFFSTQEVGRKIIFPWNLRNLHENFKTTRKMILQFSKKTNNMILLYHGVTRLLTTEKSCFSLFGDGKYRLLFIQEVNVDDILFSFEYHVYWLLKDSCFGLFRVQKYVPFFIQIIFTWYFLSFHEIPKLWKYGFWCSDERM